MRDPAAVEAVAAQDAAASRLQPAWVAALSATRADENSSRGGEPPDVVTAAVRIGLAALYASTASRYNTAANRWAAQVGVEQPELITSDRARDLADAIAPDISARVWEGAIKHAASSPASTDGVFAKQAAISTATNAANQAVFDVANELGLAYKIWISRGDGKVRDLHRRLHGRPVKLDKPFWTWEQTGQTLSFPGDVTAPIDAWINCRCFMIAAPSRELVAEALEPADLDKAFGLAACIDAKWSILDDIDAITAGGAQTDGCMVALAPPLSIADQLSTLGSEDPSNLHITLAYLGTTDDVDVQAVHDAVAAWAGRTPPMDGQMSGYGTFYNNDEPVLWAGWDIPGLERWREELVTELATYKAPCLSNHGFQIHMTLAYGEFNVPTELPDVPPITFDKVAVAAGGEWTWYELTGSPSVPIATTHANEVDL